LLRIYLEVGDNAETLSLLRQAVEKFPEDHEFKWILDGFEVSEGKLDEMENAIAENERDFKSWGALLNLLFRMQPLGKNAGIFNLFATRRNFCKAIEAFERLRKYDVSFMSEHYRLYQFYLKHDYKQRIGRDDHIDEYFIDCYRMCLSGLIESGDDRQISEAISIMNSFSMSRKLKGVNVQMLAKLDELEAGYKTGAIESGTIIADILDSSLPPVLCNLILTLLSLEKIMWFTLGSTSTAYESWILDHAEEMAEPLTRLKRENPRLYSYDERFFDGIADPAQRRKLVISITSETYELKKRHPQKIRRVNEDILTNPIECSYAWEVAIARLKYPKEYSEDQTTVLREGRKTGRNEPCPCGSRKKYKKCCGLRA
jgi:tetratricopeptide (TPR) repeat protein